MIPREEFKEIFKVLRKEFPGAFPRKEFRILKRGIDLDILKKGKIKINRTKLRMILRIYTFHPLYVSAHTEGANRYDLEGKIVSKVTEQECLDIRKLHEKRLRQKQFINASNKTES